MKTICLSVFAWISFSILTASAQEAPAAAPEAAAPEAAAPDAAPDAALKPRIVCDEPNYDFGERDNTEFVEHDYPIRNEGTLSLEIRNVHASCGCTAVKPSQDVIPPGGEASIRARLDLRGRNGLQQKTITVQSNDPDTPTLTLQLKGTAIQPLRAQPSALFFGRIGPADARSRICEIISARGPIQITSLRSDHPGLLLKQLDPDPGTDGSTQKFELTIDPALPEGSINGSVFVKTDQADQPEISIPVAAYVVTTATAP